ncbi:MAG TPA: hypothetical protein DCQ50_11265 [Chryseobacterium sp.]|nr:hypothetical protein [Chryseobacterium sp.]
MNMEEYEVKYIWENAIFIFDTSSLLNFYEYSEDTINDIFSTTFADLNSRLWLPNKVNEEFQRNRQKPINKIKEDYTKLSNNLKTIENNLTELSQKTKFNDKHPYFSSQTIPDFEVCFNDFKEKLNNDIKGQLEELSKRLEDDRVLKKINEAFNIKSSYTYSRTCEIIREGEFRFRNKIPPGYKDEKDKTGFQKYADLIIWKQVIDISSETKKPIIFIMDDIKEDWWTLDKKRNPICPRPELIAELKEISGQPILIYQTPSFLEKSREFLKSKIQEKSIKNIVTISEERTTSPKDFNGISLSANYEEDEPFRLWRLKDVAVFYSNNIQRINITGLHDHKGDLTVYWKQEPTTLEKRTIELAWENQNELEENVEHIIE